MEVYEGIKFRCKKTAKSYEMDERLVDLDRWVHIMAELGLAPIHSEGAYGNHSLRAAGDAFFITRTGMIPRGEMKKEDYCLVESYEEEQGRFRIKGRCDPSSESFLHLYIYRDHPSANVIMHGHSGLLNNYAESLGIPVTSKSHPYGTVELARSAVQILSSGSPFIILKDHGFVAMGKDIDATGNLVLTYYGELLELLKR